MKVITREIIESFEKHLYENERSENTVSKYLRDVRMFYNHSAEKSLTKADILAYKRELCEKYMPQSVNSVLSSINALFRFMGWYDLKVKTLKIQRRIFADKEKELSKAEYERLLTAAKNRKKQRLYYIMQTICATGIRVSELKFITVSAVKYGRAEISCKGKLRTVFLPKTLCKMLKDYIKRHKIESGSIFITRSGKPIDRSNVWSDMKKICESAGVTEGKVFPHNLRHLFARTYYSLQKDIVRLADILGHSNIETTRIYTMETGSVHKKQIEKLGLLLC